MAYGVYPGGANPDVHRRLNLDRYVLVCRRGSAVTWDGKTLTGLRGSVGTQLGYSVADDLRHLGIPVDEGAPGAAELMHKLQADHVAAAAMLEGEAWSLLSESPRYNRTLQILPVPLVEKPYYLLLSHSFATVQAKRAEAIWNAIEKVRESKDYQALEKLTLQH
jgi:polar amino acid transport system substrate-binding protein